MPVALQVHKAFEYLEKSVDADKPDVRYVVRVRRGDGSTTGRGIYLREPLDTLRKLTFMADVKPTFHEVHFQKVWHLNTDREPLDLKHPAPTAIPSRVGVAQYDTTDDGLAHKIHRAAVFMAKFWSLSCVVTL